jgi:hypothetical protein
MGAIPVLELGRGCGISSEPSYSVGPVAYYEIRLWPRIIHVKRVTAMHVIALSIDVCETLVD